MNANQKIRFDALAAISRIWYNEDGTRTDTDFDFSTLFDEIQSLKQLGRSAKWQNAVDDWHLLAVRAFMSFRKEESEIDQIRPVRDDYTQTHARYDHWFTWALFGGHAQFWI